MYLLNDTHQFPPIDTADENGLLAIGGDLHPDRLIKAYKKGIFPWYNEDEPICWWSPDPRFVLFPSELLVSKSMKKIIQNNIFEFRINSAFEEVMRNCKTIFRPDQDGTWISNDVIYAYNKLHQLGYAHSAEAWLDNKLIGGLYGIQLGGVFFGESMFSTVSNASKFAFIKYVQYLKDNSIQLIDCQIYTSHLESLGAKMISRNEFSRLLETYL